MALLDAKEWQFGRQNVYAATVGASDLPTTNNSGVIQVGDQVINLSGSVGQPISWVCTAQSATSVTWAAGATLGSGSSVRTVAGSTTLLSTDKYLFVTAAGTVTLPAPSSTFGTHAFTIKASGAAAQPITITAASGNLDNVATGSQTLTANEAGDYFTDGSNWYSVGRDPLQQVKTQAPPYTVSSTQDKYLICSAGTVTMPASTIWPIGSEVIIHASASSVTITPVSGTINGSASQTLAANASSRLFTDGANYFTAN